MDIGWQYKLGALVLLFILSAFFSGSEVALFSLDKKKLPAILESNPLIGRYLKSLLDFPRRLLVTILIGSTIVNVGASIITVSIAVDYAARTGFSQEAALTIQIVVLTILLLVFGELTPKVWANRSPITFAKAVTIPLYWLNVILFPVSEILTESIRAAVSKFKINKAKSAMLPEEINELANLGHERGTIIEEEHGLIQSIVNFRSVAVHEVMTHRVDLVAASTDMNFDELLKLITENGHSRIPLYKDDLDEIVGIIYSKDLLPYLKNPERRKAFSITRIAHKPMFIPRTKLIAGLMHDFQEKKIHMAIVVDEYGGTAGIITLEDIIEEIIGEIRDESDIEENPVQKIDDNTFLIDSKVSIEEVNELLNTSLEESEEYETVGGFVYSQAGHIPKEGYSFQINNHKFVVKEVQNKRIKKVAIEKLNSE